MRSLSDRQKSMPSELRAELSPMKRYAQFVFEVSSSPNQSHSMPSICTTPRSSISQPHGLPLQTLTQTAPLTAVMPMETRMVTLMEMATTQARSRIHSFRISLSKRYMVWFLSSTLLTGLSLLLTTSSLVVQHGWAAVFQLLKKLRASMRMLTSRREPRPSAPYQRRSLQSMGKSIKIVYSFKNNKWQSPCQRRRRRDPAIQLLRFGQG